jgi:hypothetical protein
LILALQMFPFSYSKVQAASYITVEATYIAHPGFIWCQHIDGHWSAGSTYPGVGTKSAVNDNGQPSKTASKTYANISTPSSGWKDMQTLILYSPDKVSNMRPVSAIPQGPSASSRQAYIEGDQVVIEGESGQGIVPVDLNTSYCGGQPGANYIYDILVTFTGQVEIPQGTLYINHFTETGANLSGVFPSETRTMEINSSQTFSHKTNADYIYLGYKKSSVSQPSGGTILTGDPPSFTYDGTYPKYWVSYYYEKKAGVVIPDPEPEPEPETPANLPPVAEIDSEDFVRAGDELDVGAWGSYDPDGYISKFHWTTPGANGTISGPSGIIWYANPGGKRIDLVVEDNGGMVDDTAKGITVTDPVVEVKLFIAGTLKQNRKVQLTSISNTPKHYPIVSTDWTIVGVNGSSSDVRSMNNPTDTRTLDALFKKAGDYRVTLTVVNSAGFSATDTKTINITPDLPPTAEFSTSNWVYRNKNDANSALIEIKDMSLTLDNDPIAEEILTVVYNKNNNYYANSIVVNKDDPEPGLKDKTIYSNFTDDVSLDIGIDTLAVNQIYPYNLDGITITVIKKPNGIVQVKSDHVGRYLFGLKVTESFGQPTILDFVTSADYQFNNTTNKSKLEKIVTIDNRAPVVNFKP